MEFLRQFIAGIQEAWQRLNANARVTIVVAAIFLAVIFGFIFYYGSQPQFVTLYSGLSVDDAGAIQSYLAEQNIPSQVRQNGTTIQVPVTDAGRIRLELATQGLPKSQGVGVGLEIFDRQNLTSSESLQQIQLQRAVQGEAQRQLSQFNFVNRAHVTITPAKESLFIDEQQPSKAAVTLDLKRPITPVETKAILHVVSSFGGAHLSPDHITLVDTTGRLWHQPPESGFAAIANSKLELIRQVERERERSIEEALQTAGFRSVARVSAKLDFDELRETSKKVTQGIPVSTYTVEQSTTSSQSLPEGAPGVTANPPEGQTPPALNSTEETVTESIENIEPSVTTTERTITPGNITGYRVAVMVSGNYVVAPDAGEGAEPTYVPRTDDELEKIRTLVAAAVGTEVDPAEDVTVSDLPMPDPAQMPVAAGPAATGVPLSFGNLIESPWPIVQAIAILIMALLLRRWLVRASAGGPEEAEPGEAFKPAVLTPDDLRRREMMGDIERAFTQEPDNVANIIRTWMKESE